MTRQPAAPARKPLYLTEEEALTLLDLCLMAKADDAPLRAEVMTRIGDLCRDFLRGEGENGLAEEDSRARAQTALDRVLRRREAAATCA